MENDQKEKTAVKTLTCPSCGAEVSARRRYCPECGAVVRPFVRSQSDKPDAATDAAEPDAAVDAPVIIANISADAAASSERGEVDMPVPDGGAEQTSPIYPDNSDLFGFDEPPATRCPACGRNVRGGTKFCIYCGAPLGAPSAPVTVAPVTPLKTCDYCGAPYAENDRFCRRCGWTIADGAKGPFGDKDGNVEGEAKKRRNVVDVLGFLSLLFSGLLTAVFACTPYLGFTADGALYADIGFSLIAALFGQKSALNGFGVAYDDIKHAGWTYFALLLGAVVCIVCVFINTLGRKKNRRQFGTLISAIFQTVAALSMFVSSLVSAATVGANGGAVFYIGGIGVFVCAAAGLALAIVSAKKSRNAYPRVAAKITPPRIGYLAATGVAVMAAAATFFLPLVAFSEVGAIKPGDGGRATLKIDEKFGEYYIGTTVFELAGLEQGASYFFTVNFDTYISAENLEGALLLCYADNVCGDDVTSIDILTGRSLMTNQTRGASMARLTFTNTYSRNVAIVVNAAAYSAASLSFDYSFRHVK